jgi:hypothetical protein
MTATYYNRQTKETYKVSGVRDLEQAWNMSKNVCKWNNWNHEMFCEDVKVSLV